MGSQTGYGAQSVLLLALSLRRHGPLQASQTGRAVVGRRGYRKAWAWSARGGLSAFGSKAQPVVRMGGDRRSRIPKARC